MIHLKRYAELYHKCSDGTFVVADTGAFAGKNLDSAEEYYLEFCILTKEENSTIYTDKKDARNLRSGRLRE